MTAAPASSSSLGLIAGNGVLPRLVAEEARRQGVAVHAVGHVSETDPSLASLVDSLGWVKLGQLGRIAKLLRQQGVTRAILAGGIGRVRAFTQVRPDWAAVKLLASVPRRGDDALLRAIAAFFEGHGIRIVSATEVVPSLLTPTGHLAGPKLGARQSDDVRLGLEVAELLGQADVGQTVVVREGNVLALEAVEGTDAAIRRGGELGGPGAVVVKLSKRGQDDRFDLPAVGPTTLETMSAVGARVLALESGKSLLLDGPALFAKAEQLGISLVGVERAPVSAP